jgi:hypothetical protein
MEGWIAIIHMKSILRQYSGNAGHNAGMRLWRHAMRVGSKAEEAQDRWGFEWKDSTHIEERWMKSRRYAIRMKSGTCIIQAVYNITVACV